MKRFILTLVLVAGVLFLWVASGKASPPQPPLPPMPPPPPEQSDQQAVESAILEAIVARQEDVLGYLIYRVRVDHIRFSKDGLWASAWLGFFDPDINDMLPTEPGLALVQWDGSNWKVTLPSDEGWAEALMAAPESMIAKQEKEVWLEVYRGYLESLPSVPFIGYLLPWPKGQTKYLSQSVGHDQWTPSGSMHFAFDFYVHDVMWNIYASKAGTVWKLKWDVPTCYNPTCSDTQPLGNYIVLKDITTNPTSYQLYLHLAYDSIPAALRTVGATVVQGQLVGLADNTGQSWGDHLHFQVHANPTIYIGTAVDIKFGDVDINGGRPRVYEYDHEYCLPSDVCNNYRVDYVSGNEVAGDIVPPTGDITSPATGVVINSVSLPISGWASDVPSGLDKVQITVNYDGTWRDIGPELHVSPFNYSWNWCSSYIPDGAMSLSLRITDMEGNQTWYAGMKHITKNYACPNPPTPACSPGTDEIALYNEPNYTGDCVNLDIGDYSGSGSLGALFKTAESIQVGSNMVAILYSRKNYLATVSETFYANDRDLWNNRVGSNTVASVQVRYEPTVHVAPNATWPPDGFTYTDTHRLSLQWEYPWAAAQFQARLTGPVETITTSWQTDPYWRLPNLAAGSYTWQVRSNLAVTWSESSPLVIVADVSPEPPTVTVPYTETMETGTNGWSGSGLWRRQTNQAYSGSYSWRFGENPGGNDQYSSQRIGDLTSPPILVPSGLQSSYYLRFWYRYQTETRYKKWDQRWVQISVDGGSYSDVLQLTNDPMDFWVRSPAIDLSAYAGHEIRVRFHFDTLDTRFNDLEGWYIDDVMFTSQAPPNCVDNDNDPAHATLIHYGDPAVAGVICPGGDLDYYKFSGSAGDRIVADVDAQTLTPSSPLDTFLVLMNNGGATVLAEADDELAGVLFDPKLGYVLPSNGTYYLLARSWDHPTSGGDEFTYQLRLYEDRDDPAASVLYPPYGGYLGTGQVDLTAWVQDSGSGAARVDFFFHPLDWFTSGWEFVGSDNNGSDGWSAPYTTTVLAEGRGYAVYIHAYDQVGNWIGAGSYDLGIDHTPPTSSMNTLSGTQSSSIFLVTWVSTDTLSGVGYHDLQMQVDAPSWQDYSLENPGHGVWVVGEPAHAYSFRVRAVDQANNAEAYPVDAETSTWVVPDVCTSPDSWEVDNSYGSAHVLDGVVQEHSFCNIIGNGTGDQDWFTFNVTLGERYQILALPTSPVTGIDLSLFAGNGTTLIAHVASAGIGDAVTLSWVSDRDGAVYLRASHIYGSAGGNDIRYLIRLVVGNGVFLPVIFVSPPLT